MGKIIDKKSLLVIYYPDGLSMDVTGHTRANAELAEDLAEAFRKGKTTALLPHHFTPDGKLIGGWRIERLPPPMTRDEVFQRVNRLWDNEQHGLNIAPNMEALADLLCDMAGIPETTVPVENNPLLKGELSDEDIRRIEADWPGTRERLGNAVADALEKKINHIKESNGAPQKV